jgi:predicted dehydrogenase
VRPLEPDQRALAGDVPFGPRLDELLGAVRPGVSVVCTPMPTHVELALTAARAGSHVLLEKPPTPSWDGYRRLCAGIAATGRAVQVGFQSLGSAAVPAVRALVADGAIGEVRSVQADLGVQREFDPEDRLFSHELGGGALLDLGVYVVSFAQMLLGDPDTVTATGSLFETGVDAEVSLLLGYADGRSATLMTSLRHALPGQARVFGTAGWIDVPPRFHHPQTIVLHRAGAAPEEITAPPFGAGYSHELIEVTACLRAGRSESVVMPLADTLAVQAVLEQAAGQLGVTFAEDPTAL